MKFCGRFFSLLLIFSLTVEPVTASTLVVAHAPVQKEAVFGWSASDTLRTQALSGAGLEFPQQPFQKMKTVRFFFAQGRLARYLGLALTSAMLLMTLHGKAADPEMQAADAYEPPAYAEFLKHTDPDRDLKSGLSGIRSVGPDPHATALHPAARMAITIDAYFYGLQRIEALGKKTGDQLKLILAGDSRPSGDDIRQALVMGLSVAARERGIVLELENLGIVTTPNAESAVRSLRYDGAVMITASHNPLKDNGVKFMTAHNEKGPVSRGALLDGKAMGVIVWWFNRVRQDPRKYEVFRKKFCGTAPVPSPNPEIVNGVILDYMREVAASFPQENLKALLAEVRTGVDTNGGSGGLPMDEPIDGQRYGLVAWILRHFIGTVKEVHCDFGVPQHAVLPEGEALKWLEDLVQAESLDYGLVTDYDADRATTVRKMDYQVVTAFNVMTTLSQMDAYHLSDEHDVIVVAHEATSKRIEAIAQLFDRPDRRVIVRRVETGEVNVVSAMQQARRQGYYVPIGVEGANAGTVLGEATCRDAVATALLTAVALADPRVRSQWESALGLRGTGLARNEKATLEELVKTLPARETRGEIITGIESARIPAIKAKMESEFLRRWDEDPTLRKTYASYNILHHEGTKEITQIPQVAAWVVEQFSPRVRRLLLSAILQMRHWMEWIRGEGRGGWAIVLRRHDGTEEFLQLRPSITEPVVRDHLDAINKDSFENLHRLFGNLFIHFPATPSMLDTGHATAIIQEAYNDLYRRNENSFDFPYFKEGRFTAEGLFTPSDNIEDVVTLLRAAGVRPGKKMTDAGSGDGRIPIAAAGELRAEGEGVEIDPTLHLLAVTMRDEIAQKLPEVRNVNFFQNRIQEYDFSKSDVVYYTFNEPKDTFDDEIGLMPESNFRNVERQLAEQLKPGGVVIITFTNYRFEDPRFERFEPSRELIRSEWLLRPQFYRKRGGTGLGLIPSSWIGKKYATIEGDSVWPLSQKLGWGILAAGWESLVIAGKMVLGSFKVYTQIPVAVSFGAFWSGAFAQIIDDVAREFFNGHGGMFVGRRTTPVIADTEDRIQERREMARAYTEPFRYFLPVIPLSFTMGFGSLLFGLNLSVFKWLLPIWFPLLAILLPHLYRNARIILLNVSEGLGVGGGLPDDTSQDLVEGWRAKVALAHNAFSAREWEVLDLIGRALGNNEIAVRLNILPNTVAAHFGHMKTKLGITYAAGQEGRNRFIWEYYYYGLAQVQPDIELLQILQSCVNSFCEAPKLVFGLAKQGLSNEKIAQERRRRGHPLSVQTIKNQFLGMQQMLKASAAAFFKLRPDKAEKFFGNITARWAAAVLSAYDPMSGQYIGGLCRAA